MFENETVQLRTHRHRQWLTLSVDGKTYNQREWNEKLISTITEVTNQINEKTQRGQASYIVCGSGFYPSMNVPLFDPTKTLSIIPTTLVP